MFQADYWYNNSALLSIPGVQVAPEPSLPLSQLPEQLSPVELREAYRACKGMTLRQEIFALDAPAKNATDEEVIRSLTPYSVALHNCRVTCFQQKKMNRHAIFQVHESEALSLSYERNPGDARMAHTLTLETDKYGHPLKSVAVVYGRQLANIPSGTPAEVWAEQQKTHLILSENTLTDDEFTETAAFYALPAICETKSYELTGVTPPLGKLFFDIAGLQLACTEAVETGYESHLPNDGTARKRLIEQTRVLFLSEDLISPLAFKKPSPSGLPYESYQLAFTEPVFRQLLPVTAVPDVIVDQLLRVEGNYVHFDDLHGTSDTHWWIRSGTVDYLGDQLAPQRFYQPAAYTDATGAVTSVFYFNEDATRTNTSAHWGLLARTLDAMDNESMLLDFDFRTMQALRMQDINGNKIEVLTDDLGLVIASAVLGKGTEADSLDQLKIQLADRTMQAQITQQFFDQAQEADAAWLLQDATSRWIYDLNHIPARSAGIVRERHVQDLLQTGDPLKLQYSFEYTGGAGNVVMKKIRVAPGDAWMLDAQNQKVLIQNANPRWVGNGRTVMNNKGKAVKQYEPFFAVSHAYESDKALTEIGVTPVMTYDSAGRLIRTDAPDGTFSHTVFDAWSQQIFDANDTVKNSEWYASRMLLPANDPQRKAAIQTELHDQTPATLFLDSLGRMICTIAHNRWKDGNDVIQETFPKSAVVLDIEGNVKAVIDARGLTVMQHSYDMLGRPLYQLSMDAGERLNFPDSTGKPLYSWDQLGHRLHSEYDVLHRPLKQSLSIDGGAEQLIGLTIYGEQAPNALTLNLRGKAWKTYGQSGLTVALHHDFKGNLLSGSLQYTKIYDRTIYWPKQNPDSLLDPETFQTQAVFDALNRPVRLFSPQTATIPASEIIPGYEAGGKLTQVDARMRGSSVLTPFVKRIDYNEKGQRLSILYGNSVKTTYDYEPDTFRMKRLQSKSAAGTIMLQDLNYVYDPAGNITLLQDNAQQSAYFNNAVVEPDCAYEYDALYQLIRASGREHIGQNQPVNEWDNQRSRKILPGDAAAMQRYDQQMTYDEVGNILSMIHRAGNGNGFSNQWTRDYSYAADSNRLNSTTAANQTVNYSYNAHGSMTTMPHLQAMDWNFAEHLTHIQQGTTHAYYTYDGSGQRTRKVVEKQGGLREVRLYIGGFELFRKYANKVLVLERETLHVMDDKSRIALVDTCTFGDDPTPLIRYQFGNQLGSASLETDGNANIISYEEYHPFGTTSWQAGRSVAEVKLKRYRYTGMERDEESGLNYHSARYYATWLGRWTAADPIGIGDGLNVYAYVKNNPVSRIDSTGNSSEESVLIKIYATLTRLDIK